MGTGSIFAKRDVSVNGTYYMMVFEWKHLSKDTGKLEADVTKLKKSIKNHNIERIGKEMANIDGLIEKEGKEGYKLAYRNSLLLRRSILTLRYLARVVHKEIRGVEELENELIKKVRGTKAENLFKEILEQEKHADDFTDSRIRAVINDVHGELQKEQKGDFDLLATMEGKTATGLTFKGNAKGIGRMMQLRWGAMRKLRKNLKIEINKEHKVEEDLQGLKKGLRKLLTDIAKHHAKIQDLKKAAKTEKKEIRAILKELKEFFKAVEEVIKASYKIFIFDLMLLKVVVGILFEEIELDKKLIQKHEIPRMLGYNDLKALENDKQVIHGYLKNLEKFLLQLWNL